MAFVHRIDWELALDKTFAWATQVWDRKRFRALSFDNHPHSSLRSLFASWATTSREAWRIRRWTRSVSAAKASRHAARISAKEAAAAAKAARGASCGRLTLRLELSADHPLIYEQLLRSPGNEEAEGGSRGAEQSDSDEDSDIGPSPD